MGSLKIVFLKRALHAIEKTTEWYQINLNLTAANYFKEGIYHTIEVLSRMPSIGRKLHCSHLRYDDVLLTLILIKFN